LHRDNGKLPKLVDSNGIFGVDFVAVLRKGRYDNFIKAVITLLDSRKQAAIQTDINVFTVAPI
jgi:hypothetical protein